MTGPIIVEANGARIPAIGLGTYKLAGEQCVQAVAAALKAGYRHIDAASMYGNEELVGEGLRAGGVARDDIFVTTKVWTEDITDGDLQRSAEASLGRLGLDRVDLLLIHWPNARIPLASSIKGLVDAKRRGLTRHIGVSNFTVALLDEAVRVSSEPLVANQCEHHPRLDQTKVAAACARHGLAFTAYSPLGRGELPDDPVIRRIAGVHGKSGAQVILRWHVQQGHVAIPKSGTPSRIAANFDIWDFALSQDEMAAISGLARPDGRMISPSFAPAWDS
jgi:diketogulonate reductase-like aldo/keto reductase